jgi:signal transduction histidine kinase/HAMP domain-containing protein
MIAKSKPVRMRVLLSGLKTQLLSVVLVVIGLTAAIVYFPWLWASQRNIDDVVSQVNEQITQDTAQELERLFDNVHSTHQLIILSIKKNIFDVYDPQQRDIFFLNILRTQPNFTFVQFAYPNGDYIGAQRIVVDADKRSTLKLHFRKWNAKTSSATKFTDIYHEEVDGLKLIGKEKIEEPNWYSPSRPWYKDAIKAAGQTAWTAYVYRSTKTPGIDANITLYKNNSFFGIVGVGFELRKISLYLEKQQKKRRDGGVFILNSKRELIASTDPSEDSPAQLVGNDKPMLLKPFSQVKSPLLAIAQRTIDPSLDLSKLSTNSKYIYFDPNTNQKYFISLTPAGKLDWLIGTIIPESNYLAEINRNQTYLIIVITFFVITIAGVAILLIDKVIAEPITSITKAAVRVAHGDLNVRVPTVFPSEIGVLAKALNQVTTELQTSKDELQEYNRNLDAKVEQRTSSRFSSLFANEIGILAKAFNEMTSELQMSKLKLEEYNRTLEQKVAQRSSVIKAILDNITSGLAMVDPSDRIIQCNPALLKMLDKERYEVESQLCSEVFTDELPELIGSSRDHPDQMYSTEINISQDGIGKVTIKSITVNDHDQPERSIYLGSLILVRDITFERQVDRMKTDFVSSVSHELRTPLTSVLGFARLIQKKLNENIFPILQTEDKKVLRTVKQVDENLNIIVSEGNRLTKLINDVLDIAKMEAGKVDWAMEPIQIEEVIDRAMSATSSLFENKGIKAIRDIEQDIPITIADQNRLIQVVINLISNAVKFQDEGSITCQAKQKNGEIIVSVIDQGMGISEEDIPKVFEKFKQVGNTLTSKPQGTGLGLPICKEIIEHHGGALWAESKIGVGSTFYFNLPIVSETASEKKDSSSLADLLHRVCYFEKSSPAELQSLVANGYSQNFRIGELICREGETSDTFYLILSGEVEVFAKPKELHIAKLKKGEFFGEVALFMGTPRTASVKALSPTTLFVIHKQHLEKLMQDYPALSEQIVHKLAERKQVLIELGILHEDYLRYPQTMVLDWVRSRLKKLSKARFE